MTECPRCGSSSIEKGGGLITFGCASMANEGGYYEQSDSCRRLELACAFNAMMALYDVIVEDKVTLDRLADTPEWFAAVSVVEKERERK